MIFWQKLKQRNENNLSCENTTSEKSPGAILYRLSFTEKFSEFWQNLGL